MADILHVSGLCVSRGRTEILRGVDWRVRPGEHWFILGPNGCGKTSQLKSITGYLSPSSGAITLLGETYGETDWRDLRLKIGIAPPAPSRPRFRPPNRRSRRWSAAVTPSWTSGPIQPARRP